MSGSQSGQEEPLGCNEGKCSRCNKREHQDVVKESVDQKAEQRVTQELQSPKQPAKYCEEKKFRKSPNGNSVREISFTHKIEVSHTCELLP